MHHGMRVRLLGFSLFAFSIAGILAQGQVPQPQGVTLRGTVMRMGTSEPLADVQVVLTDGMFAFNGQIQAVPALGAAVPQQFRAITGRDGLFTFPNLMPGRYTLWAARDGYFGPRLLDAYPPYASTTIVVTDRMPPADLQLLLIPSSSVSGNVRDPEGRPVVGYTVQAFQLRYQNQNGTFLLQSAASTATDDRGDYRLYGLPPGRYYLALTPDQQPRGFARLGRSNTLPLAEDVLVRTFQPNEMEIRNARPLDLQGGEDLSGQAINVRRAHAIKISGRVLSTAAVPNRIGLAGQPLPPVANLILVPQENGSPEEQGGKNIASVLLDASGTGTFEVSGIVPGSYDLYARLQNPEAQNSAGRTGGQPQVFWGRTSFVSGDQDLSGLSVVMSQGVDLTVYSTMDGSATAAADRVTVVPLPIDSARLLPGYGRGNLQQTTIGPDGRATIPFVNQGLYRFQVNVLAGAFQQQGSRGRRGGGIRGGIPANLPEVYVEDIREGGVSVYDNGLLVGAEPPAPIEVILKTNGGRIDGVVYDSQQQLKALALVLLAPSAQRRQNPAFYQTVSSNVDGRFTLRGIPPGRYTLFAFESIGPADARNPQFLSRVEQFGQPILINASTTINTQVTVVNAGR